ncbi:HAMP domain-containing sensor histidine kinase [Streptomyces coelicoflavus]|uniref:sensor histidine kinase n=1 Tax=Streptomyces coelicoflavus TaxID=285562 RepID=UPI002E25E05B
MKRVRIRPHPGLFTRLLTTSLLVAVCAVAATAWLTVAGTTGAIRDQQGQSLDDDTRVYDALIAYAATHSDWGGVRDLVGDLAARTGRAITVTTPDRTRVAGSEGGVRLPYRPTALVDPLRTDPVLSDAGPIDPRAVGPFLLSARDREELRRRADRIARCLRGEDVAVRFTTLPSGRPTMRPDPGLNGRLVCDTLGLRKPLRSEGPPLDQVNELATECMKERGRDGLTVWADFSWTPHGRGPENSDPAAQECVTEARRKQLSAYVSPPVLLFVGDHDSRTASAFHLSTANTVRVAGAAGLVLAVAAALTALVGRRLVRPLRALISAAGQPADVAVRVPVTTRDEIGRLSAAFNDLADRRESLERQRKSLVSDVAHELRTPLTNMRGWLEAGQDGLTPVDQDLVALLLEEAVLLQHVIDDLRDLAAADADTLVLHREPLYVRDLVDQVVAAHRGTAGPAGVTLGIEVAAELVADADRVRLRQVIGNLVSNAIRHTPGGGRVVVRAREEVRDLVVEVADSGDGIEAADLEHVFDRFWRADRSRSRHTGGSGLGLAIVRKLTEAHGGSVSAASTPGAGSVFTLRLPRT